MKKFLTTLSILAATAAPFTASAAETSFTPDQKTEIEAMIKDYIQTNPSVVMDALEDFRMKELERIEQAAQEKAADITKHFKEDTEHPMTGNPEGDIVVVEFFDYNCGYCKKALTAVQELSEKNDDVKVIFVELPILGESSVTSAQWALAAQKQGKYFAFHQELMMHRGQKNVTEMKKLAEKIGLDVEQLEKDAEGDAVQEAITKNRELAQEIGVSGTPAFLINDQIVKGFIPYAEMEKVIKDIRAENAE